jgi:excisionase family DNA binding protein
MGREPPQHPSGHELLTVREAAERLGIAERTAQDWCHDGKLPVWQLSPRRRYVVWDLVTAEAKAAAELLREQLQEAAAERAARRRQRRQEARLLGCGLGRPDEPAAGDQE